MTKNIYFISANEILHLVIWRIFIWSFGFVVFDFWANVPYISESLFVIIVVGIVVTTVQYLVVVVATLQVSKSLFQKPFGSYLTLRYRLKQSIGLQTLIVTIFILLVIVFRHLLQSLIPRQGKVLTFLKRLVEVLPFEHYLLSYAFHYHLLRVI